MYWRIQLLVAASLLVGASSFAADVAEGETGSLTDNSSIAEYYAMRGDEMMDIKDLSAARKFYEYAADAGSARAVIELILVNDSAFVARRRATQTQP